MIDALAYREVWRTIWGGLYLPAYHWLFITRTGRVYCGGMN